MGQMLSEPKVEKLTERGGNDRVIFAASGMQGWRISMEDAHTAQASVPSDPSASFFAVFDGHGGQLVSKYAAEHLHDHIFGNSQYAAGNYAVALKTGVMEMDQDMQHDPNVAMDSSGSTVIAVLIKDGKVFCANAGDSRCVCSTAGVAVALSYDHKPEDDVERQRIRTAGGFVSFGRVNGAPEARRRRRGSVRRASRFFFSNRCGAGCAQATWPYRERSEITSSRRTEISTRSSKSSPVRLGPLAAAAAPVVAAGIA